ncbi:SVM family protein [Candidatus Phytoplasma prunorum]|uniref:SVM family protein n=1 Tax=Candidatus Phytoplasma prunorum TaxID=47565 RepID=UPI002FF0EC90
MFKLKNKIKVIYIYLFICLGLFLIINNKSIMAMEHNQNPNTPTLSSLMLQGKQIIEQISNSQNNHLSERDIINLHARNAEITRQIFALLDTPRNLRQRRTNN